MTTRFSPETWRQRPNLQSALSAREAAEMQAALAAVRGLANAEAAPSAQPADASRVPEAIFIPECYEPNYAYPLIVWVAGDRFAKQDLGRVMPQISTRNYFGLTFHPPFAAGLHPNLSEIADRLQRTIASFRRRYHLHTERVFMAGVGDGATLALDLGLFTPEWFAGVIAISGKFPARACALRRFDELRGKRVLLTAGAHSEGPAVHDVARLLHAAGMRVCTRLHDTNEDFTPMLLREVDRWVMHEIYSPGGLPSSCG